MEQAQTVGCVWCGQEGTLEDCFIRSDMIRVVIKEIIIGELEKRDNRG